MTLDFFKDNTSLYESVSFLSEGEIKYEISWAPLIDFKQDYSTWQQMHKMS